MIHYAVRQTWLVVFDQRNAVFARNILGRHNDQLIPSNAWSTANAFDFSARNRAANGGPVKHAGQFHVIDIARLTGDFVQAFSAWNALPDDAAIVHQNTPRVRVLSFSDALVYDNPVLNRARTPCPGLYHRTVRPRRPSPRADRSP